MRAAPFRYVRALDLDEALDALARPGGRVLAGGQSLLPLMHQRKVRCETVVDIARIPELRTMTRSTEGTLTIGAAVTQRQVEGDLTVTEGWPLLSDALAHVGNVTIRNRGTVGGSAAHAEPAAEVPSVLTALDARFEVASEAGMSTIAAPDFFTGRNRTALHCGELLVRMHLPVTGRAGHAWVEFGPRLDDLPYVGVAVVVRLDGEGVIGTLRVVVAGAGDTPEDATADFASLVGADPRALPEGDLGECASRTAAALGVLDSPTVPAGYRRRLIRALTRRAVMSAADRAAGRGPRHTGREGLA